MPDGTFLKGFTVRQLKSLLEVGGKNADPDLTNLVPVVFTAFVAASLANRRLPVGLRGIISCMLLC